MDARALTFARTGEAAGPLTLGSVWRDDRGQDLAEYAILIGLIALVVVAAVAVLGQVISETLYGVINEGLKLN